MIQPEEQKKEAQEMQNLNPQIMEVEIGIRNLRKIKLYPLAVGDQMKMTSIIATSVSGFLVSKEAKDESLMIGFFIKTVNDNLARFLSLALGEKEQEGTFPETEKTLEDITNLQASEIAEIIFKMNYEESVKNFQSLFEKVRKLFPSEGSLPESVKDTITDLKTSSLNLSKKEDLQEDK